MRIRSVVSLVLAFGAMTATAEVSLPNALSDHAVLQRDVPVRVWGWGAPKENVTVKFHGQTKTAVTDKLGAWQVMLDPEKAGGPYTLNVTGDQSTKPLTRTDILVGEVWIASGQSNMEFQLQGRPSTPNSQHPEIVAAATHPQLRMLHISHNASPVPLWDVKEQWTQCTPESAATLSAVAYWFALQIQEHEHVPVGILQTTWGGTPVHSWTSLQGLATLNADAMKTVAGDGAELADGQGQADRIRAQWAMEDAALKAEGKPIPKHRTPPGDHLGSWTPATLYNAMVAPVAPYTVRGAIWYQGESDATGVRAKNYVNTFPNMISDWRKQFANPQMPFLFVQISNWKTNADWGSIRDAQRRTLALLPNTGMAVTLDVGTPGNIHPPDKKTVGDRLALVARGMVYGEDKLESAGPLFDHAVVESASMRVFFTHGEGLNSKNGLGDFEVQDASGKWVSADAKIDGATIVVNAPSVSAPVAVRYAWHGEVDHYFYNKAGLPAGTFTSEK